MRLIAFDFVIKHRAKKINSVDAFFKRFDYQNINIEIKKLLSTFQKNLSMIDSLNADVITRVRTLCAAVSRDFRFKDASCKSHRRVIQCDQQQHRYIVSFDR